jgi:hypothetical protein
VCLLNIKLLLDLFVLYHLLLNLDMLFTLPNIFFVFIFMDVTGNRASWLGMDTAYSR